MSADGWFKSSAVVMALALMAVLAAGCGKSADTLYREGKELLAGSETQTQGLETLAMFEKRFPRDRRVPEVMLAVASVHQNERRFAEAEAGYSRLMEKYPRSAEAYKGMFLLAYMYCEDIKDTGKAGDLLKRFIADYPDSGLTASARVLLENIGLPVEEWSTVKNIMTQREREPETAAPSPK